MTSALSPSLYSRSMNETPLGFFLVIIDPRQHKGLPHRRYHGKVGTVTNVGKRSVTLDINLGNKTKTLITRLDHIKPFGVK